ncbi:MAG: peptide-methionine (S)-S-oxide reductase MsrA [Alphaproteobacteria bacterium]
MAVATFGAGCFWHPQHVFDAVPGVTATKVGYMGGTLRRPSYTDVCGGNTGHAEVVQLEYDPDRVSYDELLAIFFDIHDPCQRNRQGPDIGTQYRSVIFCHDTGQQATALRVRAWLQESGAVGAPLATAIEPAQPFWIAEDYHQHYIARRSRPPVLAGLVAWWRGRRTG